MTVPHLPVRQQVSAILQENGYTQKEITVALAIMSRESGGKPDAENPAEGATASGIFQFIDGTYDAYAAKVVAKNPQLAGVMAKENKNTVQAQTLAFAEFTRDNMSALSRNGIELTAGNIYAAHFLGAGGAVKVLNSDPNTPLHSLVSEDVMRMNASIKLNGKPFADFTAGDLEAWAAQKMAKGGAGSLQSLNWAGVMESSPEQIIKELGELGTDAAKQMLTQLTPTTTDKKLLETAADLVRKASDAELTELGEKLNGSSRSLAELVGGNAAGKMLALSSEDRKTKLASEFVDKKLLDAYKKLDGSGVETVEVENMTVEQFLTGVDAKQKKDKQTVVADAGITPDNPLSGMLNGAMEDMGLMGFVLILLVATMFQMSQQHKQEQAPQTIPINTPDNALYQRLPGVEQIRADAGPAFSLGDVVRASSGVPGNSLGSGSCFPVEEAPSHSIESGLPRGAGKMPDIIPNCWGRN